MVKIFQHLALSSCFIFSWIAGIHSEESLEFNSILRVANNKPAMPPCWLQAIQRHELSKDHPVRAKLDALFAKSRVIKDLKSLKKAGFKADKPMETTHMILASHPAIPGYLFKIYLDDQLEIGVEYHIWMQRINGAEKIRKFIKNHHLKSLFKVPQKWIYLVPADKQPIGEKYYPRDTLLVVQDMQILSDSDNKKMWGSKNVTEELLEAFSYIILHLGLWDSAKIANAPFCKDGKIAFVDTQEHGHWPIRFDRLTFYLPQELQEFWNQLFQDND